MHVFLETERLVLRRFTPADADLLVELYSDPDVMRFISGGRPTPREEIQDDILPRFLGYYERFAGYGYWAAIEKSTGEFVGWFHFRPRGGSDPEEVELGYRLRPSAWGKGYATEGSRALIAKGFSEFGVQRVVASTMAVNLASRRVMEKAGLALVRAFHQSSPDVIEGAEHGDVEYALSRAEWEDLVESPLGGGDVTDGVVRIGGTVRRPRGPHSGTVALYLRHLEHAGFAGAPRWLGIDEKGRDILDFVAGEVPGAPPQSWSTTDEVLADVARLLHALHDASAEFTPPPGAVWFGAKVRVELPDEVEELDVGLDLVTHSDVTPQNVVFRDGRPVAIIDYDLTRPTTRLLDVVNTAMHWVPLKHPADREPVYAGIDPVARLQLFVDAYGLGAADRARLVDVAQLGALRSWYRMKANAEQLGGGWKRMWDEGVGERILRRRAWMLEQRERIDAALVSD